jgi:galactose-3-O-sulfotransferase
MNSVRDDRSIIYVHLPKCGGTTFNRIIEWEYPPLQVFSVDPAFFRWSYQRLRRWPQDRLARIKVFKGHMPFGLHKSLSQPATYITVLRDPIDRAISQYYFPLTHRLQWRHRQVKNVTLEEYIERTPYKNVQTKLLSGLDHGYDFLAGECSASELELAKRNLSTQFSLIGLTERFDESLALAKVEFGWRIQQYADFNVTRHRPKKDQISAAARELVTEHNRFDVELYRYALELFDEKIKRNAARIQEELNTVNEAKELNPLSSIYYKGASAARKTINRLHSAL